MGVPRASSLLPSFSSVRGRFSGVASLSEPEAENEAAGLGVSSLSGAGRAELLAGRRQTVPDSRGRFVGVQSVPWAVSVDDTPVDGKKTREARFLPTSYVRDEKHNMN